MSTCIEENRSPEDIDQALCSEIYKFSEQEEGFWSSIQRDPREFVHSLFQYPAMMVPIVQYKVVELITKVNPRITIMLDPYVGAGTTLTAAMSCGLNCFGQDINPLAILISKAKTDFGWTDEDLLLSFSQVINHAKVDDETNIAVMFPNMEKWFRPDVSISLSKIRRAIMMQEDIRVRRILWVIFAETIRLTSNDRTTTYKLHSRSKEEINSRNISPIAIFEQLANQSAVDILKFKDSLSTAGLIRNNNYGSLIELSLGSTTDTIPSCINHNEDGFQLLVTSPPYGDNTSTITYGQHSYLPLQWIDISDIDPTIDETFLRTTQEIDRRSLGGHIYKQLNDHIKVLEQNSDSLSRVFNTFQKTQQPRDRSARIASYYCDFITALDRILSALANNSYLVWTIGNRNVGGMEIPNDEILVELLSRRNTTLVTDINRSIHFKRMPHKNKISKMMGSEKIMIFRKLSNGYTTNERTATF